MPSLLRQPLLHFLLLGALIFLIDRVMTPGGVDDSEDSHRIVVDREALLGFMQYRAQAFDADEFAARLDALDAASLDALVADYVREEVLYREALGLGMDQGDYIIRQRLVQKIEFLLEDLAAAVADPDEATLRDYFMAHFDDYRVMATYDFTHVFFDFQPNGADSARARAERTLALSANATVDAVLAEGDRYPFLQDYTERSRAFVVNNFGAEFVAGLDGYPADATRWQGPLMSRYGYHLVLLRNRTETRDPDFADARPRVLEDYRYQVLLDARQAAEERIISEYEVDRAL